MEKNKTKTNKLLYLFVIIGIVSAIAFSTYALTPGVAPNPGHLFNEISVPSGCTAGEAVSWNGNTLTCSPTSQKLGDIWVYQCPVETDPTCPTQTRCNGQIEVRNDSGGPSNCIISGSNPVGGCQCSQHASGYPCNTAFLFNCTFIGYAVD